MEALTIDFSYTKKEDGTFRLDAEHYRKEYLTVHNTLINCGSIPLSKFISRPVMTGHTPSMKREEYYGGTTKFIKTDNLREFNITDSFTDSLTELGNNVIKRSTLKEKDVVITIIGATHDIVGRTCLIQKKDLPANINQNIALIRVSDEVKPEFLTIYLNTYYGRSYLWFLSRQTEQVNLNCREIEKLLIPKCSPLFQDYIAKLYSQSFDLIEKSKYHYHDAESSLLSGLGLLDWRPKHTLSFVRNYSETEHAERFDAEYFQPKYDEIAKAIKKYKGGWDTLGNLCKLVGHPSNPPYADTDDNDKTFIVTQKHLGDYSLNDDFWKDEDALYTTQEFIEKNNQYVLKQNDVLLYSVGAYIGKANIYKENIKATIGSFLTLLRAKKERINPYYLMAFLNTEIGVMMSKQHQRGMAQQYLYPYDIRTFPIPLLNEGIQTQIQQKITESFNLRQQSKHLLECAKKAVEMAIERDEKEALKWLKEQTV
jgi:restriction endonuclease S subunit